MKFQTLSWLMFFEGSFAALLDAFGTSVLEIWWNGDSFRPKCTEAAGRGWDTLGGSGSWNESGHSCSPRDVLLWKTMCHLKNTTPLPLCHPTVTAWRQDKHHVLHLPSLCHLAWPIFVLAVCKRRKAVPSPPPQSKQCPFLLFHVKQITPLRCRQILKHTAIKLES